MKKKLLLALTALLAVLCMVGCGSKKLRIQKRAVTAQKLIR